MKNEAIGHDASPEVAWGHALRRFDRELRRRGAAERTRRAYGAECGELAQWAAAQRLRPDEVGSPLLRRWAASAPRKLASARAFFRVLVEHGDVRANPAEPPVAPALPHSLEDHEVARVLDRFPATTPLELRDRAIFELAHACGLRPEELVSLDLRCVDFDAHELRAVGKGARKRSVPAGEPVLRSVARYLERGRGTLARDGQEPALFLSKTGRRLSASDVRRRLQVWARLSSMSTTPVYTRVESARLRAAYERSHPRA